MTLCYNIVDMSVGRDVQRQQCVAEQSNSAGKVKKRVKYFENVNILVLGQQKSFRIQ